MSRYTITLRSGRQLTDLSLNGSMFVSQEEITKEELSPEELSQITIQEISDSGTTAETEKQDQVCDAVLHWPEGYLFNVRDMSEQEKALAEIDARIAFLEMMGGYDE